MADKPTRGERLFAEQLLVHMDYYRDDDDLESWEFAIELVADTVRVFFGEFDAFPPSGVVDANLIMMEYEDMEGDDDD